MSRISKMSEVNNVDEQTEQDVKNEQDVVRWEKEQDEQGDYSRVGEVCRLRGVVGRTCKGRKTSKGKSIYIGICGSLGKGRRVEGCHGH